MLVVHGEELKKKLERLHKAAYYKLHQSGGAEMKYFIHFAVALTVCFSISPAAAKDKVIVIPLNSTKEIQTPVPIPDLVGSWIGVSPGKCFSYENYLLPNQSPQYTTMPAGVFFTVTTQEEELFAGYSRGPDPDLTEPPAYFTGIIQGNKITIQMATDDVFHRVNVVLDLSNGQQKLVGTFEQFENQATASNPGIMSCTVEVVKQ